MSMIDTNFLYNNYNMLGTSSASSVSADKLEASLSEDSLKNSTDEELMDVCKSFESYFIEQVYKEMKKSVKSEEDDSEYMQYFGDILTQSYADQITESGGIGLAQMLYDSMKRSGY